MYGVVAAADRLTPSLVRVVFEGDGLDAMAPPPSTDAYINIAIPPAAAPYETPFEISDLKGLPHEQRPYRRRYTVRAWNPTARLLTVDFVVHGDAGAAGPWAANAKAGDVLVFTGPAGTYSPNPEADWHLFAGDESALPAIAASLEALDSSATAVARLVCDGPEHEIELQTQAALDVLWLHRTGAADPEGLLPQAVTDIAAPGGRAHAFVHGEAAEVRAVRRHLLADRDFDAGQLSCSPYWRRGYNDEEWRKVKAAWVADVERDVT